LGRGNSKKKNNNKNKNQKHKQNDNTCAQVTRQNNITSDQLLVRDITCAELKQLIVESRVEAEKQIQIMREKDLRGEQDELLARWYNMIGHSGTSPQKGLRYRIEDPWNYYVHAPIKACWANPEKLVENDPPKPNALKWLPCSLLFLLEIVLYILSLFLYSGIITAICRKLYWYCPAFLVLGTLIGFIARLGPCLQRKKLKISKDDKRIERAHAIAINVVGVAVTIVSTIAASIIVEWLFG
jgi:hypothetical protein